jgi:hypothetical protein
MILVGEKISQILKNVATRWASVKTTDVAELVSLSLVAHLPKE